MTDISGGGAPAAAPATTPNASPAGTEGGHATENVATQPDPPAFDWKAAGYVYRTGAEGQPGRFVRPVKVDGAEIDVDLADPKTWDEYSLAKASHRRMEKAALTEKQVTQLLRGIQDDPEALWHLAKQLGHDPDAIAESRLRRAVEEARKPAEVREMERAKREAAEYRQRLEQIEAERQRQDNSVRGQQLGQQMRQAAEGAAKAAGFEPDGQYLEFAKHIAQDAWENGKQRVDFAKVAQYYQEQYRTELPKRRVAEMAAKSPEAILEWLGADGMTALQRAFADAQRKKPAAPPSQERTTSARGVEEKPEPEVTRRRPMAKKRGWAEQLQDFAEGRAKELPRPR